jgi:arsenite/tail-anchored protein-transporting ATPase
MRIALHTGKGGVGKTTLSAATAIAAAAAGHRTLLLSTDPAHSVADVLARPVGADPTPVAGVAGLWAAQVDTRTRFEHAWADIRGYLVGALSARGIAQVQAEELTVLPGAEEIVALLEVYRYATEGQFDVLVVDCAPSGESLRLLALPETIRFYADRLLAAPARLLRALATGMGGLGGRARSNATSTTDIADSLGDLLDKLTSARDLLADSAITGVRIVLTPERVVIAEARRLLTALALHGYAVEAVLVNRVLPDVVAGTFLRDWRAAQVANMPLIAESFPNLAVHIAELSAVEPIGVDMLEAVARSVFKGADPMAGPLPRAGLRTEGERGRYRLILDLPLAERGAVELSRAGNDLVVTVGPHRRRIALPSALQRCRTTGARFDDDALVVEFVADPGQWPSALISQLPEADLAAAR